MEIDQLGNYTDVSWFMRLSKRDTFTFFHALQDIWEFRVQLSDTMKWRICPMGNPFVFQDPAFRMPIRTRFNELTEDRLRLYCLTSMEQLVYTALDVEDRKLGAMYVLMALTLVSVPARANLTWLYSSAF
jgi:hypothetical protein